MVANKLIKFRGATAKVVLGSDEPSGLIQSMSSLRSLISTANDGDTIDLGGNTYMFTEDDFDPIAGAYDTSSIPISDKSLTIQNGEIRGTTALTNWTDEGSGVFSHDLPSSNLVINTCFWHLLDSNLPIENQPKPVVSTALVGEYTETPFCYSDEWYTLKDAAEDITNGSWITYGPANPVDGISAGEYHTVALMLDGTVECWGRNDNNQCTLPKNPNNNNAEYIGLGASQNLAIQAAAGGTHTVALLDNNTVLCWGDDSNGQCTIPGGLANVTAIAAGSNHTVALLNDGSVVCWGDDTDGQCSVPGSLGTVAAIAAGGAHTVALLDDGSVVCWGNNTIGQCNVPASLGTVTKVAAGSNHTVALLNDGSVVCWGDDTNGQCTIPGGLANVTAIAAGGAHTAAVINNTSVECWGDNSSGQCTVPTLGTIGPGSRDSDMLVAAGSLHTAAVTTDGQLFCWGAGTTEDNIDQDGNPDDLGPEYGQSIVPSSVGTRKVSDPLFSIVITDSTLKSTIDSILSQNFANGRYWALLHASSFRLGRSPIVSWDEPSGVITLDGTNSLKANASYLHFSIYGGSHNLSNGEYCLDASNNKIYYKPTSGNPNGAELPIMPLCFFCNNAFNSAYVDTFTLNNVSFNGFCPGSVIDGAALTTSGYIIDYPTDYIGPQVVINNCNFGYGDAAFGAMKGTLQNSNFYRFTQRGILISEGDTVSNCSFIYVGDASSCISARTGINEDTDRTMATTTIQGCFFNTPTSTHGQPIALYYSTWQHATVKNCVFLNHRAITFNPDSPSSLPTDAGELLIENNLVYTDAEYTLDPNLSIIQANSPGMDTHLDGQVVKLRNNAFIANLTSSIISPDVKISRVAKQTTVSLANLQESTILSYNNLYGGILLDKSAGTNSNSMESIGNGQTVTSANLNGFGIAWSSDDRPFTNTYSYIENNFIDYTDLSPQHVQGLLWSSIPTPAQLYAKLDNWTSSYNWSSGIIFGTPIDPNSADGTSNVSLDYTASFEENDYRPPVT